MDKQKIHYSSMIVTNINGRDFFNAIRITIREEIKKSRREEKLIKEVKHEKK